MRFTLLCFSTVFASYATFTKTSFVEKGEGLPPGLRELGDPAPRSLHMEDNTSGSARLPESSDSSTEEAMESEEGFTTVRGRRLKRKLRRTSPRCGQPVHKEVPSFMIGYVTTSASDNLNSLNRQFLTEFFDRIAPGQINEVRINPRKNILMVDAKNATVLETLKNIQALGNFPVRSFKVYGKDASIGVISDVDPQITEESLARLVISTVRILNVHRFGLSRCVKLVFDSSSLPAHVKVGYVRHPVRPYVPRPLQCHRCQKIGHVSAVCKSSVTCQRCGESHQLEECKVEAPKCPNCAGTHDATSKLCPKLKDETRILRKMVRDHSSRREAAQIDAKSPPRTILEYWAHIRQPTQLKFGLCHFHSNYGGANKPYRASAS